jgi:hypothetical protein
LLVLVAQAQALLALLAFLEAHLHLRQFHALVAAVARTIATLLHQAVLAVAHQITQQLAVLAHQVKVMLAVQVITGQVLAAAEQAQLVVKAH